MDNFLNGLSKIWRTITGSYWALEPVRFSIIISLLTLVAFCFVDQGVDILNSVVADADWQHWFQLVLFFLGLALLSFSNWWWPRFLLNCEFGHPDAGDFLRSQVPRFLGVLPAVIIAASIAHAWLSNRSGSHPERYTAMIFCCLALSGLIYFIFYRRRRFLKKSLRGALPVAGQQSPGGKYRNFKEIRADRGAFRGLMISFVPSLLLWFFFTCCPVRMGLSVGSAFVLFIALGSWVSFASIFIYFGHRYKLPILTILIGWVWLCSWSNDNHAIRQLDGAPPPRINLAAALKSWHDRVVHDYPNETNHPLFIVTAEGGGIRAAYWTSLVLANLQDNCPSFYNHLFAISGISGGSLGGGAFVGMLGQSNTNKFIELTDQMLGQDFLAPLVGKMLFPDLVQRFIFFPVKWNHAELFDRATALEEGWEHSVDCESSLNACFSKPFSAFYCQTNGPYLPALFLNGTEVESGRRIITSSVAFDNQSNFFDMRDGVALSSGALNMRLSTAVHNSARFTYFSPAGRYPDGTHVVDGGYFENYGAETARDILAAVKSNTNWTDVAPAMIIITDDPEKTPSNESEMKRRMGERIARATSYAPHELFTPVAALWKTRDAHGGRALTELESQSCPAYVYKMEQKDAVLPLGWVLSQAARTNLIKQLSSPTNSEATTGIKRLLSMGN